MILNVLENTKGPSLCPKCVPRMQIATELNYSERYTRTKHVEGLRAVEEILEG